MIHKSFCRCHGASGGFFGVRAPLRILPVVLALVVASGVGVGATPEQQAQPQGFWNIFQNIFNSRAPTIPRPQPVQIRSISLACIFYNVGCPSWYIRPTVEPSTTLPTTTTTTTVGPRLLLGDEPGADTGAGVDVGLNTANKVELPPTANGVTTTTAPTTSTTTATTITTTTTMATTTTTTTTTTPKSISS